MESLYLESAGRQIHVQASGTRGPAVLFIHGNSFSSRTFRKQLEGRLSSDYSLFAVDLPGHGSSPPDLAPHSGYSIPAFAEVVRSIAEQLDIERGFFVGWSLGGHVLLEAAPSLPHASGFCVFGTPPLRYPSNAGEAFLPHPCASLMFKEVLDAEEMHSLVQAMFGQGSAIPTEFIEELRATDPRLRPAVLNSLTAPGFADQVAIAAALRQPLAILHGRADGFVNANYLRNLEAPTLWRGNIQFIPGAGHAPHWETPNAFDELVSAFIKETGLRSPATPSRSRLE